MKAIVEIKVEGGTRDCMDVVRDIMNTFDSEEILTRHEGVGWATFWRVWGWQDTDAAVVKQQASENRVRTLVSVWEDD